MARSRSNTAVTGTSRVEPIEEPTRADVPQSLARRADPRRVTPTASISRSCTRPARGTALVVGLRRQMVLRRARKAVVEEVRENLPSS